ncbi:hypothetical protein L7F22_004229 [Adiantum nelumboides]|nr:hypothetical protein [Adiantum nelumboides]
MFENMPEEERVIDFGTLDLQNDVASPGATWAIDFLACKLQEAMANPPLQSVVHTQLQKRHLILLALEENSSLKSQHEASKRDTWGPCDHVMSNGCQYFITFTNDYNRMTWVYFLKAKSEAFEVFLEFNVMVEKENGCHIECLRTDGEGEYMSHSFDDCFGEQE